MTPPSSSTSAIVHHVPVDRVDVFLDWQKKITRVAESFSGYRKTDVYPPTDPLKHDWVVLIQFDSPEALGRWSGSPERAACLDSLPPSLSTFSWFAQTSDSPPAWRMALVVLMALYPTVVLLTMHVGPHLGFLGVAGGLLVSNVMSVSLLQWVVMPLVDRVTSRWIRRPSTGVRGLLSILGTLGAMTVLFRFLYG